MKRIVCCAFAAFLGCSEDKPVASPADAVHAALEKADLDLDAFKSTDAAPFDARACERGTIDELHITMCAFADEKSAAAATEKMESALAGDDALTVVVQQLGTLALGVVDPGKVDPNGKAIVGVLKRFQEK